VGEMFCWGERGGEGAGRGGRGARACVRACTRRLTCPLLPDASHWGAGMPKAALTAVF
jgi:hypothetical protein